MTTKAQRLRQRRMETGLTVDDWFNMVSEAADEIEKLETFKWRIEIAHEEHLKTGDYVALGIAAQDAINGV